MARLSFLLSAAAAAALIAGCSPEDPDPIADPEGAASQAQEEAGDSAGNAYADEAPVGRLGGVVAPTAYSLDLVIDPREDRFSGTVEIALQFEEARDHFFIHGKDINAAEVTLTLSDGETLDASYEEVLPSGVAVIELPEPVGPGQARLSIDYDAPFDRNLAGLYRVDRGEERYAVTQFEAIDARRAFPGFDEPFYKVPFDIAVTARDGDVVSTTTPVASKAPAEGREGFTRYEFERTRPLPTYLIAFAVGPYDVVDFGDIPPNEVRDRPLPLRGLAAKGQGEKLQYALENTPGILTAIEEYFDIPFPYKKLDLVAAPDYAFGAMENVGLIVYREFLLLLDEDAPLRQKRAYASVHSHELAHQWFGNLVTPVWWDDIWLNEAFATWMGNKGVDAWNPEGEFDRQTLRGALGAMATDSLASTRQIREPVTRNEAVMDAFDGITYRKGGGVLSMIESYVGVEKFRKGVQTHMERYADDVATAEDFFKSVADGSGEPEILGAFRSFVGQPGVPLLTIDTSGRRLEARQTRYAPLGSVIDPMSGEWIIPVCLSAVGSNGKECSLLEEREGRLKAPRGGEALMPNADGAGYYRFNLDSEGWATLTANVGELSAKEVLAYEDSLEAAFRAGGLSAADYLAGVEALAERPEWDVASAPVGSLRGFYRRWLDDEEKEAFRARFSPVYKARFIALQGDDSQDATLLKDALRNFVVFDLGDEALRADYAETAARVLGLDGEADASALDPDLFATQVGVLVEERPMETVDAILARLADERNPVIRLSILGGLGEVEDDQAADRVRGVLLDELISGREMGGILFSLLSLESQRDATWEWFKENFDAAVARLPQVQKSVAAATPGVFCSAARADEAKAFIESKADAIPGYERTLDQALETVALCAALKEAKAEEFAAAL